ncbi:MAG TPA: ribonuclease R [Thermodesulfovibrionales bacterium]|nr:ribonuclease R [Thermodesulfovibrionales bacterium]
MITKDRLLTFFREKVTRPLSFREIVYSLDLSSSERRSLKRILREMSQGGYIVKTRKGLYGPAVEMSLVTGCFEAHREGYGFVVPEEPKERDIFIPPRAALGAMDNDRVVARIENPVRREGRIIRILGRAHTRVVGTCEASRTGFYVRPKNKSIPFDLYIAPKDRGKARGKDSVIAEIVSYPTDTRQPIGRVIKILDKPGTPKDEVESIIDEFNLPRRFPHNVLEESRELYSGLKIQEDKHVRNNLMHLPTVTIDGERAKDFDDAVSIQKTDNLYRLWVHIADVGYFVGWDSAIDVEARKRGTSVYFPDSVVPMLPKELSEDLCSLRPKVERLAFTVEMEFDKYGERLNRRLYPSIIMSDERLTYTSVKKILIDRDPKERGKYHHLLQEFEIMGELCNVLKDRRIKRGSLDFDLPEPEVLLDIQGNPEAIIKAERNFAHMIIEEFMIAANEAVAEYFESHGIPGLYRIHEEPETTKVNEIISIINSLETSKARKTIKARDVSELIRQIRGLPEEEIIILMILRGMKQARYSALNIGHFGLASEFYTHFTSPIRRYPDLVVHRILREALTKKYLSDERIKELEHILPDIAFHSSRMERQSEEAERAVLDAMRAWFVKDKTGEEFEGMIVSVTPFGLKIRLKDYYIEGFLHVSYMTDDFYRYDDKSLSLYGVHKKRRFSIGKELTVRIDRVDLEEREIILGI